MNTVRILALESSCDETAAALVERELTQPSVRVVRSIIASQAKLHEKYGGVYPEVASREHIRKILPVIAEALDLSLAHPDRMPDLSLRGVTHLAVTVGPGLIGSLLVGTQTMATLAYASGLPLIPVNHLAGHIYASFVAPETKASDFTPPKFPLVALVVSGGHTMLIHMRDHHHYQLIGQTRDDAAGEAFDKVAKLLGLGYPGGPLISQLAAKGDREAYTFPIGLEYEDTYDFSFSGLKTAVLRQVNQEPAPLSAMVKANSAASFERAVVDALLLKTKKALDDFPVYDFVLGGGVAANSYLRERLATFLSHQNPPVQLHVPPSVLCTDNATVIGAAAAFQPEQTISPLEIEAFPRYPLVSSH